MQGKTKFLLLLVLVVVLASGCSLFIKPSPVFNPELASKKKYDTIGELHGSSVTNKATILTDGNYEATAWDDGSWLGLKDPSMNVTYIIDLEEVSPIVEVSGYFVQTLYGIDFPKKLSVSVSEDKTTWSDAVEQSFLERPSEPASTGWAVVKFPKAVTGRYVKIVATAKTEWVFCKEISIKKPKTAAN